MNQITNKSLFSVSSLVKIALLSAVSIVLMLFEIPLWFAPSFYKIDFSEVAVLMGAFAMGPLAGVMIELIKILLNFTFDGTITMGIGEVANFLIGCALVLPAAIIYKRKKNLKHAIIGLIVGVVSMAVIGSLINYFVILPVYSQMVLPLEALIKAGTVLNPYIVDLKTFVLFAVTPFNLLKGVLVAVITLLFYKRLSRLLHA